MANVNSNTDTLKPAAILKKRDTGFPKIRRVRSVTYKAALVLHDLLVVLLAFGLTAWLSHSGYYEIHNFAQAVTLYLICLIAIAFYPSQNLYNYHLIYSKKYHLIGQIKSTVLSLLALGLAVGIHFGTAFLTDVLLISLLVVFSLLVVLFSRYFRDSIFNVLGALGAGVLIIGIADLVSSDEMPLIFANWWGIVLTFLIAIGILSFSRFFLVHVVFNIWMRRRFRRQVVMIGSNEEANNIGRHIIKSDAPFWIAGVLGITDVEVFLDFGIEKCFLGSLNELPGIVNKNKISEIIVTDENIDKRTLISFLDYCTSRGVNAWFPPNLMPIIDVKLYIDNFCGIPMIRLCSQKHTELFNKIKHGLDALMTLPAFVLLLPFFLITALIIKLNSKGPVFYRARSVGKNGKLFDMYKFRSMYESAGNEIHKEYVTKLIKGEIGNGDNPDQPLKITKDPRVTPVGKFLRKTSLDELPQLINVLKTEMSLVGPRPCLPYEWKIYKEWHKKRTCVRPGITGLWQVSGRSDVAFEDMILLDLYYIYNRGVMMDFGILYETIFAVLAKKGAY